MADNSVEANGGPGCLFLIGAIIVASCVGSLYGEVYGWLGFGGFLIVWAILGSAIDMWTVRIRPHGKT